MNTSTEGIRQKVKEIADQLPPGATWDDVIEEIRFRRAVKAGMAAADRGSFASDEDIRTAFAKWGVKA